MSDDESSNNSLIYYPNPPIPLDQGFTDIVIKELNFIEPFALPLFEPLTDEEINEFDEILKNISGTPSIPTCETLHTPPDYEYQQKEHIDGYPEEIETLEHSSHGFQVDAKFGEIGTVNRDKGRHLLLVDGSDSDNDIEEINPNIPKRAEAEARKRADEMAEREAKNQAEDSLRKAEAAKKKAEEARRLAEEAKKKLAEEEARRKAEEKKKREERQKRREEQMKKEEEKKKKEAQSKVAPPKASQKELPPVLRNRFQNLNILNPGGAPTTIKHMKRIIQENKSNEAVVNRPNAE